MPLLYWDELAENPVDNPGNCDWVTEEVPAEEKLLSPRVFRLIPAMNFLSKSRSMAVRLPSGVERLAESRSMLDKKLCGLVIVAGMEASLNYFSIEFVRHCTESPLDPELVV